MWYEQRKMWEDILVEWNWYRKKMERRRRELNSRSREMGRTNLFELFEYPYVRLSIVSLSGVLWNTITQALRLRNLPLPQWEIILLYALHSVRPLLCTSTNNVPHERLLNLQRRKIGMARGQSETAKEFGGYKERGEVTQLPKVSAAKNWKVEHFVFYGKLSGRRWLSARSFITTFFPSHYTSNSLVLASSLPPSLPGTSDGTSQATSQRPDEY